MTPGRVRGAAGVARTDREIAAEKAAALGRAGERLEDALRLVHRLASELDAATAPVERARLHRDYDDALRAARLARFNLIIQRESIGLRHHAIVDHQFPDPAPRSTAD